MIKDAPLATSEKTKGALPLGDLEEGEVKPILKESEGHQVEERTFTMVTGCKKDQSPRGSHWKDMAVTICNPFDSL